MYGKIENGVLVYSPSILNGTINPSVEKILAAGYLPIEHTASPEVADGFYTQPRWEQVDGKIVQKWKIVKDRSPLSVDAVYGLVVKQLITTLNVDDDTALRMKEFYPTFEECVGKTVSNGFKFTHNNRLWGVVPSELMLQAHYIPGAGTEGLYVEICESHSGILEDPIPYDGNMVLENGKYYIQNGAVYLCNRDTVNPVYNPLHDLIGLYVEEVVV